MVQNRESDKFPMIAKREQKKNNGGEEKRSLLGGKEGHDARKRKHGVGPAR